MKKTDDFHLKFPVEFNGKEYKYVPLRRVIGEDLTSVDNDVSGVAYMYPLFSTLSGLDVDFFKKMKAPDLRKLVDETQSLQEDERNPENAKISDTEAVVELLYPIKIGDGEKEKKVSKVHIKMPTGEDLEKLPKGTIKNSMEFVPFWATVMDLEPYDFSKLDAKDIAYLEKVSDLFM